MSLNVFDFFSGCGGTSKGFQNAGLNPVFALDHDLNRPGFSGDMFS
ncbi:DNA cytosine methyltransferase [Nitrosomonas ureae]|nr:DNA cytosine methyltransferase [Nitrosomonas ureae]